MTAPASRSPAPTQTLTRQQIARVMLDLETRMGKLLRLEAELSGLPDGDGLLAAAAAKRARAILRGRFWELAEQLGVSVIATREEVRALAAELQRERFANDRT